MITCVMDVDREDKIVFLVPELETTAKFKCFPALIVHTAFLTVTSSAIYAACPLHSNSHIVAASSSVSASDRTSTHRSHLPKFERQYLMLRLRVITLTARNR